MRKKLQKTEVLKETREEMTLETPIKILEILALNPNITILELAQQIDKSESATWRTIRSLRKSGYLKRMGPKKGGHWEIVKKKDIKE